MMVENIFIKELSPQYNSKSVKGTTQHTVRHLPTCFIRKIKIYLPFFQR